ncbi:hypothetical protein [Comamonas sp. 23]|uniref:hypothetical protein n=2 Tax=unclassified Comamonas TaxID=2638500 RepID=UPI003C6F3FDD
MTKNRYRLLVIATVLLLVLSIRMDFRTELLSSQHPLRFPIALEGEMVVLLCFIILGWSAGFYGCMRFRPWAPALNLVTTACGLLFIVGNNWLSVESSWAQVLDFLANASGGLTLMLPYFNDQVRKMFWPEPDGC